MVRIVPTTLHAYDDMERFDVLSVGSINHLDEDACTRLRVDAAPRAEYRSIHSLRGAGRLLESRVAAYCSTSIFRLDMTRSR